MIVPPDESDITPIEINNWYLGIIPENQSEIWYSFNVDSDFEYLLMATNHAESVFEYNIYNPDNTLFLNAFIFQSTTMQNRKIFESSGRYLLLVRKTSSQLSNMSLQVRKIEDRTVRVIDSIWFNQNQQVLDEYNGLLDSNPNDPELNVISSILEIINIVENPDQRFSDLLKAFNTEIDFFPKSKYQINAATSTVQVSEIQQYIRDILIPVANRTLSKLERVSIEEPFEFIIPKDIDDQHENNYKNWFFIDNADVRILAGGLHISKSLALLFLAFELGIEPIEFNETFNNFREPENLQQFMDTHPDLLTGEFDIQNLIQSALSNWLLGTEKIREGLDLIIERKSPQSVHMFYLEDQDDVENIQRYTKLLDRMVFGLITATGGDFNGDTKIDRWDLYDVGALIHK